MAQGVSRGMRRVFCSSGRELLLHYRERAAARKALSAKARSQTAAHRGGFGNKKIIFARAFLMCITHTARDIIML